MKRRRSVLTPQVLLALSLIALFLGLIPGALPLGLAADTRGNSRNGSGQTSRGGGVTPVCMLGDPACDFDSDGYTPNDGDCDDDNSSVYPGATELCGDGLDNDCDGNTDYVDNDGDGYDVCSGTDCDDSNPSVNPGATELCGDGLDNDCDGTIDNANASNCDDGLACTVDSCESGAGCQHSVQAGSCLIAGVCYQDGAPDPSNQCAACSGVNPTAFTSLLDGESCSDGNPCTANDACQNGLCASATPSSCDDNNPCTSDSCSQGSGCTSNPGPDGGQISCGVGPCSRTVTRCVGGVLGTCTSGTPAPNDALCNSIDDDCDGSVDEDVPGLGQSCTVGVGYCQNTGSLICNNPVISNGPAGVTARDGRTPGLAAIDSGAAGTNEPGFAGDGERGTTAGFDGSDTGGNARFHADRTGMALTSPPSQTVCSAVPGSPIPEACGNSVDDDCDGSTDEGCGTVCGTLPIFDDFVTETLDPCWNPLVDPVGNSTGAITSVETYMLMIPAGTAHDCWTGGANCTRLVRSVPNNIDTVYETRIDGVNISLSHQDYGIFLYQNDQNHIRFEFWTGGAGVYVRAYKVIGGVGVGAASITTPAPIVLGATNFLRVTRIVSTNTFTLEFSQNGNNWTTAGSMTQPGFIVNKAGLFVNNAVGKPKTTLNVDYWSARALSEHTLEFTSGPRGSPNPVASAGTTNLSVTANDSLGHTLNYAWSVLSCTGLPSLGSLSPNANSLSPMFTAPPNTTGTDKTCQIQVVVNDGGFGKTKTRSFSLTVRPVSHTLTITSGPGGTPNPVAPGAVANLSVAAVDSLGHLPTFLWSADCPASLPTDGSFLPNGTVPNPTWTAPANPTGGPVDCTIKVIVHDPARSPAPDRMGTYAQTVQLGCGTLPLTENFTAAPLDPCWSFIHPNNTVPPAFTPAGHYTITVPSGASHDCWNAAPNCTRLLRAAPAGNATYVVKIDGTSITSSNQDYGIILFQDNLNYLRFEFWTAGAGVYVRAYKVISGAGVFPATLTTPAPIALGVANYLRVTKSGTSYKLEYGTNGVAYTTVGTFTQAGFTVNQAGIMVNNANANPQTSASVDSFTMTSP